MMWSLTDEARSLLHTECRIERILDRHGYNLYTDNNGTIPIVIPISLLNSQSIRDLRYHILREQYMIDIFNLRLGVVWG